MESIIKVNKFQTPLTEELKNSLEKEVWDELMNDISKVRFIQNLISSNREVISDRPVMSYINSEGIEVDDSRGRRLVNLTDPHMLENMDYFRERAIFYDENNKYTNIPPNPNPNSDYALFWKEELKRWDEGLVRPDGEWIPGDLYFYWNYSPIWLVEKRGTGNRQGRRIRSFPKPWLGDYLFFHYINDCREEGKHAKILKCRGIGMEQPHSEIVKTIDGDRTVGEIREGDYLIGLDGKETKVLEVYPQGLKDVYEVKLMDGRTVRAGYDHLWRVKNECNKRIDVVSTKEMISKGLYWNINNGKNKSYKFKLPNNKSIDYPEKELPIPPYVLGVLLGDGTLTTDSIKVSTDDYFIIDEFKRLIPWIEVSKDNSNNNYILKDPRRFDIDHRNKDYKNSKFGLNELKREIDLLGLNVGCFDRFIPDIYKLSSYDQRLELLKGLMDSDGSVYGNSSYEFTGSNYKLVKDTADLVRSLGFKCKLGLGRSEQIREIFNKKVTTKQEYRLYINTNEVIFKLPRKVKRCKPKYRFKYNPIISIKKLDYQEESSCFLVDNDTNTYLTRDYIVTHNSFKLASMSPRNMYVLKGAGNPNFHLASENTYLTGDSGIWGKIVETLDWIASSTPLPRMRISNRLKDMEIQLGYQDEFGGRKGLLSSVTAISLKDNPEKTRGIRGPLIHYEEDGKFPDLETTWNINRKSVEDGNVAFGLQVAAGTGGTTGKSFEGSEKLFYQPNAYNILSLPNVYDRDVNGERDSGFFWPGYMNRNGCYDEESGEPDVIKALIEINQHRFITKYNTTDTRAITQTKAEDPITPSEAVLRVEGTSFPVADLREYLDEILVRRESFIAEHYVGDLVYNSQGKIEWKPNPTLSPLRRYDFSTEDREGAVEIFEMPKENANGVIAPNRYIAGIDVIDSDTGNSLFSMFILDTFTDRIVAEYTGRFRTADECFALSIRLLEFYRAVANYESNLKGLFTYYSNRNKLHLLCDTPQILRDMQLVKGETYGNSSKGTRANQQINKFGRDLQVSYLLQEVDKNEPELGLKMHTIRSLGYLEEAIRWNSDGNFDRISAMGMLMIMREDRFKITKSAKLNQDNQNITLADDDFFTRNYNSINSNFNINIYEH